MPAKSQQAWMERHDCHAYGEEDNTQQHRKFAAAFIGNGREHGSKDANEISGGDNLRERA